MGQERRQYSGLGTTLYVYDDGDVISVNDSGLSTYRNGQLCWWSWPAPPEDCDHWSPDLADRADAWACAREDEELQAVYEEQLADYQRQMEYAYDMEEARRRTQEAELERQTAPWGQRWY